MRKDSPEDQNFDWLLKGRTKASGSAAESHGGTPTGAEAGSDEFSWLLCPAQVSDAL